jgi:hypothetical protein
LRESLTYADLAGRLGTSHEAARSLVRRLRLARQKGNDGTVRVNIDLAEIQHKPLRQRSPRHPGDFEALKAQVEQLQAKVAKLETEKSSIEAIAVGHRADFQRERRRSDKFDEQYDARSRGHVGTSEGGAISELTVRATLYLLDETPDTPSGPGFPTIATECTATT